jgi:hypothetical protein
MHTLIYAPEFEMRTDDEATKRLFVLLNRRLRPL